MMEDAPWIYRVLNFTIDIPELISYYDELVTNYEHLRWDFNKCKNDITDEWYDKMLSTPGANEGWGWALQSNLVDMSLPCPPYNISTHPRCDYRNTEMVKGVISRLQLAMPYAYRWALFVQPPGGTVPRHIDQLDEYTVHIPIQWDSDSVFEIGDDPDTPNVITFPADGSVYLLDTIIAHSTINRSDRNRIGIVFRFNRKHLVHILTLTGEI